MDALLFFSFFFLFAGSPIAARVECFLITGRLRCPPDPSKVANVQIDLMDEDPLPFEQDDTMGRTWSMSNGSFKVSGCGYDLGPFNTPDGYLRIFHSCPSDNNSTGELQVDILPVFLPVLLNIGSIYLDRGGNSNE